ncbi:KilA-N domain-containing protein [Pseudomonas sp. zfem002]|uniref:KilA-N domain-containing protein n=1 Tax=Pseudomonas sp. zfem002 TaxID=3078197 RepID=UPI002928BB35|nr:KilA-N domain-containing protein [Pseudomonas sp. zfem002]MDU9394319.1 KilA-N domain-containing protein [Pseudomonas sp. zfem002]
MIESNVIPFHYQGQAVRFNSDGWINATDVAKRFGKRPVDWLKQCETKEYLNALAEALTCDAGSLVETSKARSDRGGGTWLHPKLAVAFARWLDLKFAVWCDLHIDALLRGELDEKQKFDRACRALEDAKEVASLSGRELARWRNKKPCLEQHVEYWRDQLQMTLGLDAA